MTRDHLDDAIDRVARQLTDVPGDDLLATRIVAALPERRAWLGGLAFRFAAFALVAVTAGLWFDSNRTSPTLVNGGSLSLVALMPSIQPLEPGTFGTLGTQPLEPVEPLEYLEPSVLLVPDDGRSLPALAFDALVAASLPEDGPLSVEPLSIADLPLASEFLSPIEE